MVAVAEWGYIRHTNMYRLKLTAARFAQKVLLEVELASVVRAATAAADAAAAASQCAAAQAARFVHDRRQRFSARVTELGRDQLQVGVADGLVHIAIGDGVRGAGRRRAGVVVHQRPAVLGGAQESHGEAFHLRTINACCLLDKSCR